MTPVTTKLYEAQSESAKARETEISYGVAYQVAARKIAARFGRRLSDAQATRAGTVMHYGLGVAGVPAYMLLRRRTRLAPWVAGLATGVGFYAVVDEGLNPVLGFTPPPPPTRPSPTCGGSPGTS